MESTETINVMMAENNHYGHDFFCKILEEEKGSRIKITGKAANGQELLELVEKNQPHIVLLDLSMPVLDGYKTLEILQEKFPEVKVIIFSSYCGDFYVAEMLRSGARAYVVKGTYAKEFMETVHKVHDEGYCFTEKVTKELFTCLISNEELHRILEEDLLSDKEIEVLKLICKDKETKEISNILNISESTVKYHKTNLKQKTNSVSTAGLVKYAIRVGLIRL